MSSKKDTIIDENVVKETPSEDCSFRVSMENSDDGHQKK